MEDNKVCTKCGRDLPLSQYHRVGTYSNGKVRLRTYCKDCANKTERERYRKKKEFLNEFRTECAKCGDTRTWVLDFHHIDPSKKDFTIGTLKKGDLDLIKSEIDKCVVLCANCHREFHYLNSNYGTKIAEYLSSSFEIPSEKVTPESEDHG